MDFSKYADQMNEIMTYAISNGYDLNNLDMPMMEKIVNGWFRRGVSFEKVLTDKSEHEKLQIAKSMIANF